MSFEDFKREALMEEVRHRYQAIKAGKTELLSGEEVFAELLAELD